MRIQLIEGKTAEQKKLCPHCERLLPLTGFYHSKNRYHSWCKVCENKSHKESYEKKQKIPDGIRLCQKTGRLYEHQGFSKRIYWSKQMIDDLKRLFATTKNEDLAELIGVSQRTLIRKARELGLQKNKEWQHGNVMRHLKMAAFESRRLGYPGSIKKGMHLSPETEFKKRNINEIPITE